MKIWKRNLHHQTISSSTIRHRYQHATVLYGCHGLDFCIIYFLDGRLFISNNILIPIQSEFFALEGLKSLQETIRLVQDNMNNDLKILGILITMHTKRLRLARKVENLLKSNFKNKLLKTKISRNIRLAEAPDDGKPAIMYDVDCAGAKNYMELALEIVNEKK